MERSVVRPARRTRLIAVGAAVVALLVTGCGETVGHTDATGDRSNGKKLFIADCGGCHTLADAGTKGQIGPNLDFAFLQSRRDGLGESTIAQVVRGQIAYPVTDTSTGAPGMPKDIVTGQAAEDIASYVAAVAGVGAGDPSTAPATPAETAPAETTPTESTPAETTPAGGGDAAAGKAVFASAGCGSCHTLADAGSSGSVGPNLDDAKPDAALVTQRVTNGQGVMPSFKDQLDAQQIKDVAAYVSSVAGGG